MRPKKSNNIKQKDTKIDGTAVFVSFSQGNKKVPEQALFPLLFLCCINQTASVQTNIFNESTCVY